MRYIMGVILLFIAMSSYGTYIKEKFNISPILSLVLEFAIVPVIIYFTGLLNIITLTTYFLYFFSLILFIYFMLKKRDLLLSFLKDKNIIFTFILMIIASFLYTNFHPIHYDNFSHWAVIVKSMFQDNALPNFKNSLIKFKAYPPGTACFIYFVSMALGKTEGVMVVAQTYMLIVFTCSLLALIKKEKKFLYYVLTFVIVIFMMTINIAFYDLLVDTILSVVFIASCVIVYLNIKNPKKMFYLLLPLTIYLILIKNSGMLFAIFNVIFLLISSLKYNKKFCKYSLYLLIISVFNLYLWQHHVVYAFGTEGLIGSHSMSISNLMKVINSKGVSEILAFLKIYGKHFIDIFNNINQLILIVINIFAISMLFFFKENRKNIIYFLLIADIFYIIYYLFLGLMYLFSMSTSGAIGLAGFDRYLFTAGCSVIGMFIILILSLINNKNKVKIFSYISCIIVLLSGFMIFYKSDVLKSVVRGGYNYNDSYLYKLDKYSQLINYNDDSIAYYFYSKKKINFAGYYSFATRYKLNHNYSVVIDDVGKINIKIPSIVFILDMDKEVIKFVKENNYKKVNNEIYEKV